MSNFGTVPRILIRGGRVYDHEGDVHQPAKADILIAGETIERVGLNLAADACAEVIDASGKLVLPGFVNAHYHSHDVMAKGLFEQMPFDVWTLHSNPSNYGPRSLEEVRLRTLIGAIKPGMLADLIIFNLNEPAFVPFNSAARQVVFSECGRAVETVVVNGRPVVRGGKLVTMDEAALAAQVEKVAPAFRREAQALAARNAELAAPLLSAGRKAWKVPLGFERYIGRGSR